MADWGLWDGGQYLVELALSDLLSFGEFEEKANPFVKEDKICGNLSGVFRPTWYQVRSGWDLSTPVQHQLYLCV